MMLLLHERAETAEGSKAAFSTAAKVYAASTVSNSPAGSPKGSHSFRAQVCVGESGTRVFHLHYPPCLSARRKCCLAEGPVGDLSTFHSLFLAVGRHT